MTIVRERGDYFQDIARPCRSHHPSGSGLSCALSGGLSLVARLVMSREPSGDATRADHHFALRCARRRSFRRCPRSDLSTSFGEPRTLAHRASRQRLSAASRSERRIRIRPARRPVPGTRMAGSSPAATSLVMWSVLTPISFAASRRETVRWLWLVAAVGGADMM